MEYTIYLPQVVVKLVTIQGKETAKPQLLTCFFITFLG